MTNEDSQEIILEQPTKKSETGLIFYRRCIVNSQTFSVGNNIYLRDGGRNKLGYLLKIYCRTKGNERALVRWYFTDADLKTEQQHCGHEIFATSYTGKVAVSAIRKMVHVIFTTHRDGIPSSVPKDVFYVYRYFDHDKQALVPHKEQLIKVRYLPKPEPDCAGSALVFNQKPVKDADNTEDIKLTVSYTQNGITYYKMCTVGGKNKYKIGDCVLLVERDSSSIRRILHFSYNHDNVPIAMGQFIYYQNEVTLTPEQRDIMHYQEVLASNWKSELLVSNIKRKLAVIHQYIFQPVPEDALKTSYFLKRYYDPFKCKTYPLLEPLTRADFTIIPEPADEGGDVPTLKHVVVNTAGDTKYYKKCVIGEEDFSVGDYVSLQNGSVFVRVIRLYQDKTQQCVMDINRLFLRRQIPSAIRHLLTANLVCSDEVYREVACKLFFEKIQVAFKEDDNDADDVYLVGDFYEHKSKELYNLKYELSVSDIENIPQKGESLSAPDESESEQGSSSSSDSDNNTDKSYLFPCPASKKKGVQIKAETPNTKAKKLADVKGKKKEETKRGKNRTLEKQKAEEVKEEKLAKFQDFQKKENKLISELMTRNIELGEETSPKQYAWAKVEETEARVGDCVFVKLVEGVQMGRIASIYRDEHDVLRLKMFRFYLEEEMFVSRKESSTIHINEAFASDFVIYALLCQLDEIVDAVYLKKREKIPAQNDIPKGRLFVRRYYHPVRHLLRSLKDSLDADDLTILPQPHPPIGGSMEENKSLNKAPSVNKAMLSPEAKGKTSSPKKKKESIGAETPNRKKHKASRNAQNEEMSSDANQAPLTKNDDTKQTKSAETPNRKKHKVGRAATATEETVSNKPVATAPLHTSANEINIDHVKNQTITSNMVIDVAVQQHAPTIVNPDVISKAEKADFTKIQIIQEDVGDIVEKPDFSKIQIIQEDSSENTSMTILPDNMVSFSVADAPARDQTPQIISISNANQTAHSTQIEIVASEGVCSGGSSMIQISAETTSLPGIVQIVSEPEADISVNDKSVTTLLSVNKAEGKTPDPSQVQDNLVSDVHIKADHEGSPVNTKHDNVSNVVELDPSLIQIVSDNNSNLDSSQIQIITNSSAIQIMHTADSADTATESKPILPTIISSEQEMDSTMHVDITHASDGCITIAPLALNTVHTAKFEDSYTENSKVYFRKCHFKNETITQGDTIYIRCGEEHSESWKVGRTMEFYHAVHPVVRVNWYYVVEEMVTSKTERASIHHKEVFASQCYDEIEISSIESKVNVVYLQKVEKIPKTIPENTLYCRRFYDPYKHAIRQLKTRLSATDLSILPEPLLPAKRARQSLPNSQASSPATSSPVVKRSKTDQSTPRRAKTDQSTPRRTRTDQNTPRHRQPKQDLSEEDTSLEQTDHSTLASGEDKTVPEKPDSDVVKTESNNSATAIESIVTVISSENLELIQQNDNKMAESPSETSNTSTEISPEKVLNPVSEIISTVSSSVVDVGPDKSPTSVVDVGPDKSPTSVVDVARDTSPTSSVDIDMPIYVSQVTTPAVDIEIVKSEAVTPVWSAGLPAGNHATLLTSAISNLAVTTSAGEANIKLSNEPSNEGAASVKLTKSIPTSTIEGTKVNLSEAKEHFSEAVDEKVSEAIKEKVTVADDTVSDVGRQNADNVNDENREHFITR